MSTEILFANSVLYANPRKTIKVNTIWFIQLFILTQCCYRLVYAIFYKIIVLQLKLSGVVGQIVAMHETCSDNFGRIHSKTRVMASSVQKVSALSNYKMTKNRTLSQVFFSKSNAILTAVLYRTPINGFIISFIKLFFPFNSSLLRLIKACRILQTQRQSCLQIKLIRTFYPRNESNNLLEVFALYSVDYQIQIWSQFELKLTTVFLNQNFYFTLYSILEAAAVCTLKKILKNLAKENTV